MSEDRKLEHAAFMLPIFGTALIVPPILSIFRVRVEVFGVPLEVVYFFAVWLLLIIGAAVLSHFMPTKPPEADGGNG